MSEQIRGKVAQILNSREVALTIGSSHGASVGMLFDVMDQKGDDIRDPDTGEILGSIERPKVRVKITKTQERLSVASTFQKTKKNVGGTMSDFGSLSRVLMPPEWITTYETLKTEEKTWEDLSEEQSYVKIGDPVVQVVATDNDAGTKGEAKTR